jgi:hypothetical protein
MLKKMLTGLVLIAAFHSFAAFQYALEKVDGMGSKPYGYSYSLNIKAGAGSVYLTDRISYDTSFSGKVNAGDVGNFGYIDLVTGERKNAEATAVTLEDGRVAYKLGDFKEGDRIGIWVKTTDGDLGGTVGGEDMGYSDNFNNRDINPSDLAIGKLHFKGSGALFFQVVGNEKKPPSGRPLPGVLATLLIGAAAVLAFHLLRRRKTA